MFPREKNMYEFKYFIIYSSKCIGEITVLKICKHSLPHHPQAHKNQCVWTIQSSEGQSLFKKDRGKVENGPKFEIHFGKYLVRLCSLSCTHIEYFSLPSLSLWTSHLDLLITRLLPLWDPTFSSCLMNFAFISEKESQFETFNLVTRCVTFYMWISKAKFLTVRLKNIWSVLLQNLAED